MKIATVILAGGQGVRIGGDKPQRILAGQSLLAHMLAYARTTSPLVAVAMRDITQFALPAHIPAIPDAEGCGPLAGLWAAGRYALAQGCDALLSLPCDSPFVPDDLLPRLMAAFSERAALASSGGRLHPVCGLWRTDIFRESDRIPDDAPRSLMRFAQRLGHTSVIWPDRPVDPFFNINTPHHLSEAERIWQAH